MIFFRPFLLQYGIHCAIMADITEGKMFHS